tara:strand:+ start:493 stop:702 length:210 start_codon:yes stop_codon:yes gene_type:complete
MSQDDNNTPPRVPPILIELNNLAGQVFLNRKKGVRLKEVDKFLDDKEAAEKKLSDGRNPLTLKDDPRNN